jgi:hypothetical protein
VDSRQLLQKTENFKVEHTMSSVKTKKAVSGRLIYFRLKIPLGCAKSHASSVPIATRKKYAAIGMKLPQDAFSAQVMICNVTFPTLQNQSSELLFGRSEFHNWKHVTDLGSDTLIDIQARLERLESQRTSSAQPFTVSKSNHVMEASYVDPYSMSKDLSIAGPSTDHIPILETESGRRISSIDPQVLAIDNSRIQLPEHRGLADRTDTEGSSSRSNVASFQTYLGNSSTWELLAEGISPSSSTADTSDFRRNIDLLSKEDRSILQDSQYFSLNLLVQFPNLTPELIILYSSHYALEAPFVTLHWPSLKRIIEQGLSTGKWSCQGQVACVLLVSLPLMNNLSVAEICLVLVSSIWIVASTKLRFGRVSNVLYKSVEYAF